MSLVLRELAISRTVTAGLDARSLSRNWLAYRSTDEVAVEAALVAAAGTSWNNLYKESHRLTPKGGGVWECEAVYSLRAPDPPDDSFNSSYTLDLTAGTQHVTQSLQTMATAAVVATAMAVSVSGSDPKTIYVAYATSQADIGRTFTVTTSTGGWTPGTYTVTAVPAAGQWTLDRSPAPVGTTGGQGLSYALGASSANYRQAIGVTRDGVAGCDIFVPKMEITKETVTYPVTFDFVRQLRSVVAKTNNAEWFGFERGEVLYLGCTGQQGTDGVWRLNHKFAIGENRAALRITPDISIKKGAWEYLWCAYRYTTDANVLVQIPTDVYSERVYEEADFNLLRLNVPTANFNQSVPSGAHPLAVTFADLSTGTPTEWLWDFGDGSGSGDQNPTHVYTVPGFYTVSLTVTNGAGSSIKVVVGAVTVS